MKETDVTPINVAYPEIVDLQLRITVGACRIRLEPGQGEAWVTGTYRDQSGSLPIRVVQEGGTARISQEQNFGNIMGMLGGAPVLELALGKAKSYTLSLETGASETKADLGGVPISRLVVKHGAGKTDIDFSAANPVQMSMFSVSAGASAMELKNLANANFAEAVVEGGAAYYSFDFGGVLQRDARLKVTAAMSSVDLYVPTSTAVKVTSESFLAGLDVGDGFMKKEGAYWNEAALAGGTPLLVVEANVTMGALSIRPK